MMLVELFCIYTEYWLMKKAKPYHRMVLFFWLDCVSPGFNNLLEYDNRGASLLFKESLS